METSSVVGLVTTSSFVGMLVGGLITHRLTLWRDKRKEYNTAVEPVKTNVEKAIRNVMRVHLDTEACYALRSVLSRGQYEKLIELVTLYEKAFCADWPEYGEKRLTPKERHEAILKPLKEIDALLKLK
ncbi:TPA: hypothetical protein KDX55_000569 [Vibrio parahaemolyticus]|nr:hypothetical protein [Vibrio parahaemolyticus]